MRRSLRLLTILSFFLASATASGEDVLIHEIGRVVQIKGKVERKSLHQKDFSPLGFGEPVFLLDSIRTEPDARLKIGLLDFSSLTLIENSRLLMTRYLYDASTSRLFALFDLQQGSLFLEPSPAVLTLQENSFEIETPNCIAASLGGSFSVALQKETLITHAFLSPVLLQTREKRLFKLPADSGVTWKDKSGFSPVDPASASGVRQQFTWKEPDWPIPAGLKPQPPRVLEISDGTKIPAPWVRPWPVDQAPEQTFSAEFKPKGKGKRESSPMADFLK